MARRNPLGLSLIALLAVPGLLLAALMMKTHTTVAMPPPGQTTDLSGLSYKAHAFEAKIESVQVDLKSAEGPSDIDASWTFLGSNTDGQMHRVEIEIRLRNAAGKQLKTFSHHFTLAPGAHDQECVLETRTSAEDWKAAKSVELVANWQS
jgi:hypothetical protein